MPFHKRTLSNIRSGIPHKTSAWVLCGFALLGSAAALAQDRAFQGPALGLQVQRFETATDFMFPVGFIQRESHASIAAVSARYGLALGRQGRLAAIVSHNLSSPPAHHILTDGEYRLDRASSLGLAPGWVINDRLMVYGLFTYERVKAHYQSARVASSATLTGQGLGAGVAYSITPAASVFVEFKQVDYGTRRIYFDADTRTRALSYGLHYQF